MAERFAGASGAAISSGRRRRSREHAQTQPIPRRPLLFVTTAVAMAVVGIVAANDFLEFLPDRMPAATNPVALAAQSELLLGEIHGRSPSAINLKAAESLTRAELEFGRYRPDAWARLAYIALARGDQAGARQALLRSYEVDPFNSQLAPWRIRFAFESWSSLTPELKALAAQEARAFYRAWENHSTLERLANSVRDPAGRLALVLVLRSPNLR